MSEPYIQIYDEEWYGYSRTNNRVMCCDCGLVHIVDFRITGHQIQERVRRDKKATAAARRRFRRTKHHFLIPRKK